MWSAIPAAGRWSRLRFLHRCQSYPEPCRAVPPEAMCGSGDPHDSRSGDRRYPFADKLYGKFAAGCVAIIYSKDLRFLSSSRMLSPLACPCARTAPEMDSGSSTSCTSSIPFRVVKPDPARRQREDVALVHAQFGRSNGRGAHRQVFSRHKLPLAGREDHDGNVLPGIVLGPLGMANQQLRPALFLRLSRTFPLHWSTTIV